MAYNRKPEGRTYYPLTRETPLPPLEPEPETADSWMPQPTQNLTHRGQRFSKLSDAYYKITSRQESNETVRKASGQSQPAAAASVPVALPPSPSSLRQVEAQDDIQIPSSSSTVPGYAKRPRRASFDSVCFFQDTSPKMGHGDGSRLSLDKQMEKELLSLEAQPHDATNSTIDGILAQYDACAPIVEAQNGHTPEYRKRAGFSISQPPQEFLPRSPPVNAQSAYNMRLSEHDSPALNSSTTDSQHLLDAEAQAHELENARQGLVPRPLNLVQHRHGTEFTRDPQYDVACAREPFAIYGTGTHIDDAPFQQTQRRGNMLSQSGLRTSTIGDRPLRHIKVVIGREPEIGDNGCGHDDAQVNTDGNRDLYKTLPEDVDWVTEATSDSDHNSFVGVRRSQSLTGDFNRAGSSLANYSDDGQGNEVDRFGSHEQIIQHQTGDNECKTHGVRRSIESRFAALFPRRQSGCPEGANRCWASTAPQEPGQFRHQVLRKTYQKFGSGRPEHPQRLVFNFDKNAPPRYEFRDSISEYEPAAASTRANCGTRQSDTHGSLPSAALGTRVDDHPANHSPNFKDDQNHDPPQDQDMDVHAAGCRGRIEELERREFAAASSYYDPCSTQPIGPRFDFELLPLGLAQRRNKYQRDSSETNETESGAARLKRKQNGSSINPVTSPLEPPARAIVISRDLSTTFTPNCQSDDTGTEDTPIPFAMGRHNETRSGRARNYRRSSWVRVPTTPSSGVSDGLWYGQGGHQPALTLDRSRYRPSPCFIAPDDYVSDRANGIRRLFFYILVVLSILPFFGVLALSSYFSETFKWATQGEVDRLTFRQRRLIKWMLLAELVIYSGTVVAIVAFFVTKSKIEN